jgi:cyclopropane-fatty-acyl-phospholipid synthase
MDFARLAAGLAERVTLPNGIARLVIDRVCAGIDRRAGGGIGDEAFARAMAKRPIAVHTDAANAQHYEIPAEFFATFLGQRRKYSSCFYPTGRETLAEAEEISLAATAEHAGLADGQTILELGCGWGSLTLWMAEHFPAARIVAVSNSASQRAYIERQAQARRFSNLEIATADMNDFSIARRFDRVVSVEMFEHMANWRALLSRVREWLAPNGRLFLHIFAHETRCALYDESDSADWMAKYFFTGGIMPSRTLIRQFSDLVAVEAEWRWSGANYERTALQWLENFDANRAHIDAILREVYGADAPLWRRRWRMFFLGTAGSFGFANGSRWGVSHYRLKRA